MTISMNIHGTASIHAEARHSTDCEDPCNWLVLSFAQKPRHVGDIPVYVPDHTVTIFLSDATLADRLAAAINQAAALKAEPATLELKALRAVADLERPHPNDYRD